MVVLLKNLELINNMVQNKSSIYISRTMKFNFHKLYPREEYRQIQRILAEKVRQSKSDPHEDNSEDVEVMAQEGELKHFIEN